MSDSPVVAADAAREKGRPPRDNLVRAMRGGVAVRRIAPAVERAEDDAEPSANENGMPTMFGHFSTFNDWYEVDSYFEGHFLERIALGAFKKTFREQTPIVLYNHGYDGTCGDKPLGAPDVLREDDIGPYYEVPLLDASYVRDLVPALDAGLLGASFRFSVMREDFVKEPGTAEHNPAGLPERTIKEMRVSEFGPVSFPANPAATAGVRSAGLRSMTDEYLMARYTSEPDGLRSILAYLEQRDGRPEQSLDDPTYANAKTHERVEREAKAVRDMAKHAEPAEDDAGETDTEGDEARDDTSAADEDRTSDTPDQEPPAEATAPATDTQDDKAAAPERSSTPLYTGSTGTIAAPGQGPTPLYTGKPKRKGWAL